jgi:hypothetical protein
MKTFIWGGMFAGSAVGSLLPLLWGDSALSLSSVILSGVGGIGGIWGGYVLAKYIGI